MGILFFKPIPRPALWGHTLVKDYFGYQDFPDGIGQSWSFSAQEKDSTVCLTEPYQGMTLRNLWIHHQELFGNQEGEFPVIISLVGPEDDLSLQVHPDAKHAQKVGFSSGKNEAWYFIEANDDANIVYGHHAKDEKELRKYIQEDRWDELIKHLDVHPGDFVYLPAGLLHALKKGMSPKISTVAAKKSYSCTLAASIKASSCAFCVSFSSLYSDSILRYCISAEYRLSHCPSMAGAYPGLYIPPE